MADEAVQAPEWKRAEHYAALLRADRSMLAWEWLRRNRAYQEAAHSARLGSSEPAEAWGLHAFEPPRLASPAARPIWTRDIHPFVLEAAAEEARDPDDRFDLAHFSPFATLARGPSCCLHLLLSDGLRAIRVDILEGSIEDGPVQLRFRIGGITSAKRPLLSLRRLLSLVRRGTFSPGLHPAETRAGRHILMLRAHDALISGATQREIAAELIGKEVRESRWRVNTPTQRSRTQRLVRAAGEMAGGSYRSLLR